MCDGLEKKFNVLSTNPTNLPKPIRDRSGQPQDTPGVFVVKGETYRSHEIDEKGFHEKLCVSDGSGQPEITLSVIEACNFSENTRLEQTHDGSGQCKEYTSYYRKLAAKTIFYSLNNNTSTEDKHDTNHINNKYNDMNMNTRKMHNI